MITIQTTCIVVKQSLLYNHLIIGESNYTSPTNTTYPYQWHKNTISHKLEKQKNKLQTLEEITNNLPKINKISLNLGINIAYFTTMTNNDVKWNYCTNWCVKV